MYIKSVETKISHDFKTEVCRGPWFIVLNLSYKGFSKNLLQDSEGIPSYRS